MNFYKRFKHYRKTRKADPRLAEEILRILDLEKDSLILDVGCGAGGYSLEIAERGHRVIALDPFKSMLDKCVLDPSVNLLKSLAETIPLKNKSVKAAISINTLHHFQYRNEVIKEMHRVAAGPILFFTLEPRESERFWFMDHCEEIWEEVFSHFPPIRDVEDEIRKLTKRKIEIIPYLLPRDFADLVPAAAWRKPEMLLEEKMRAKMSVFYKRDPVQVENCLEKIRNALESGDLDKYGNLEDEKQWDAGYRMILAY